LDIIESGWPMGIFGRRSRGVGGGGVDDDGDDKRGGGTCGPSEGDAAADSMVVLGCSSDTQEADFAAFSTARPGFRLLLEWFYR